MSEQESRLFENPNIDNYREFIKSREFQNILFLALSGVKHFANDGNIKKVFLKLLFGSELSEEEIEILEDLFTYERFLGKLSGLFDVKNLSEEIGGFENVIEFLLKELAFMKIKNIRNSIAKKVNSKLEPKLVFTSDKYELIKIGNKYFIFLKDSNEIYRRALELAQQKNVGDMITQECGDIFMTADGDDILVMFSQDTGVGYKESLISLKTGNIIGTTDVVCSVMVVIKDGKTIAIFNGESGQTQICTETGDKIEGKIICDEIDALFE